MKNEEIARVLKYYRKLHNLTVPDVAKALERTNTYVAEKTIYGWESGQTQPDADTLLKLCKVYQISDVLSTFGYIDRTDPPLNPTAFEEKLIRSYRAHPEFQDSIKKLLNL